MVQINSKVLDRLSHLSGKKKDYAILYMMAIYYKLDYALIPEEIQLEVHKTGLVSRNYSQGGTPIVTETIFEIPQEDSIPLSTGSDMIVSVIDEWLELWPKPTETAASITYAVSGNKPACISRMRSFIGSGWKANELPDMKKEERWKVIMDATIAYIDFQKRRRWAYTKKNVKFISDSDGSLLAEWCRKSIAKDLPRTDSVLDRMI